MREGESKWKFYHTYIRILKGSLGSYKTYIKFIELKFL